MRAQWHNRHYVWRIIDITLNFSCELIEPSNFESYNVQNEAAFSVNPADLRIGLTELLEYGCYTSGYYIIVFMLLYGNTLPKTCIQNLIGHVTWNLY